MGIFATARKAQGGRAPPRQLTTMATRIPSSFDNEDDESSDNSSYKSSPRKSNLSMSSEEDFDLDVGEGSLPAALDTRFFEHKIDVKPGRELFQNPYALSTRHAAPKAFKSPYSPGNEPWINAGEEIAREVLATAKPGSAAAAALALAVLRGETTPTNPSSPHGS